jgi:hypothetical protein
MRLVELALVGKRLQRSPPPLARLDREAAARLRDRSDKVLKHAMGLDVRLEFEVGFAPPTRRTLSGEATSLLSGIDLIMEGLRMRAGAAFPHPSLTLPFASSPLLN